MYYFNVASDGVFMTMTLVACSQKPKYPNHRAGIASGAGGLEKDENKKIRAAGSPKRISMRPFNARENAQRQAQSLTLFEKLHIATQSKVANTSHQ